MAFTVCTNVAYDGSVEDDSPAKGHYISFSVKDFLHIKEVVLVPMLHGCYWTDVASQIN